MGAYMDLNDVPASANRFLLRDVLRKEWGFQGFVVSDAFAVGNLVIQGHAKDGRDAARRALAAGIDMDMASGTYARNLDALVKDGELTVAEIDAAVRPILAVKYRLGLFENPYTDETRVAAGVRDARAPPARAPRGAAHAGAAQERGQGAAAAQGPGRAGGDRAARRLQGGHRGLVDGVRPRARRRHRARGHPRQARPEAKIAYAKGPEIKRAIPSFFDDFPGATKPIPQTPEEAEAAFQKAIETARGADRVVMVLGESANMAGEAASRASLGLPGRQQELLRAVVALGKPVVLVLINGRPLAIEWAAANVPAILEAWEPGSEGGNAIADALFGDVNPGGKLPASFPREGQTPIYYARNLTHQPEGSERYRSRYWDGPSQPVYPFGHGLSYTTFAYSNLKLAAPSVKIGQPATVTIDVQNTGAVAGDEVVQLYVHQRYGSGLAPRARAQGLRARRSRAGRDEDRPLHARARRARLLEHRPRQVAAGRGPVRRLGGRRLDGHGARRAAGHAVVTGARGGIASPRVSRRLAG